MLELDGVCKRRGRVLAVDGVSLCVQPGECVVITGGNGAGKSTLLALIAGILRADRGDILWSGQPAHHRSTELHGQVGYVPEAANPPGHLSVADLLHLVEKAKASEALSPSTRDRLALDDIEGRRIDELSLGERRRACVGAALIGSPRLLVLDEPSNGLDAAGTAALAALVTEARDDGAAVVLATHDLALATAIETRRSRMSQGRIDE